jgi:hypothetical protein
MPSQETQHEASRRPRTRLSKFPRANRHTNTSEHGECGNKSRLRYRGDPSCVRCPVLRIDPDQRPRLADIRDNLTARIAEAEREGWLGEAEGLRVSLAAARDKLAQLDERTRRAATVSIGIPAYCDIAARTATVPGNLP